MTDVIACRRCGRQFAFRPHRRAIFKERGWAAPRSCDACRRWMTREAPEVALLEAALPPLFLTGHRLAGQVSRALVAGVDRRRVCRAVLRCGLVPWE